MTEQRRRLITRLRHWSNVDRDRVAIRAYSHDPTSGEDCTYSELDQLSDSIARSLRERVQPGALVDLEDLDDPRMACAFFGALKAGMVPRILGPSRRRQRTRIADAPHLSAGCTVVGRSAAKGESGARTDVVEIADLLDRLQSLDVEADARDVDRVAYCQITSSLSGIARSIPIGHHEAHRWLEFSESLHGARFGGTSLFWAPLHHVIGLYYGLLLPVFCGGVSVRPPMSRLLRRETALLEFLEHCEPLVAGGPITPLKAAINRIDVSERRTCSRDRGGLASLESLVLCGEAAPTDQVEEIRAVLERRLFRGDVHDLYVTAECPAGVYGAGRHVATANDGVDRRVRDGSMRVAFGNGFGADLPLGDELRAAEWMVAASAHEELRMSTLPNPVRTDAIATSPVPIETTTDHGTPGITCADESMQLEPHPARHEGGGHPLPQKRQPFASSRSDACSPRRRVALIGLAGTFPQSGDSDELWTHLEQGRTLISEVPEDRWDWRRLDGTPDNERHVTNIRWGGFIHGLDTFDAEFFGISAREAALMDPMQRKLLEMTWKSLEGAGLRVSELAGQRVGVFTGIGTFDYLQLTTRHRQFVHAYASTGTVHCMAPNRVSFLFDFTGPSEAIDTACSSSLVALHRAARSIREGECDVAVVGGANALICDSVYVALSNAGMLSRSGLCRTFDSDADGYVRGEGIGVVTLMSLDRAERDRHTILATLEGTAVNHGGRASSLTAPNPEAQASCIRAALADAGLDATALSYIEAHGTGTNLGDPVEIEGLRAVFDCHDPDRFPMDSHYVCRLGSIKANIGHLEAAAGISGLVKVILAIGHRRLPAHVNLVDLNEHIDLEGSPFRISTSTEDWNPLDAEGNPIARIAGISSFGFGGVNAHAIVREYESDARQVAEAYGAGRYLFVLSATSEGALHDYARAYARFLLEHGASLHPADVQFTTCFGRERFDSRMAIVFSSIEGLESGLERWLADVSDAPFASERRLVFADRDRAARTAALADEGAAAVDSSGDDESLEQIARRWLSGSDRPLDESGLRAGRGWRIPLPTYPFARTAHWIDTPEATEHAAAPASDRPFFEVRWERRPIVDDGSARSDVLLLLPDSAGFHELVRTAAARTDTPCFVTDRTGRIGDPAERAGHRRVGDSAFAANVCASLDRLRADLPDARVSIIDLTALDGRVVGVDEPESILSATASSTSHALALLGSLARQTAAERASLTMVCKCVHSLNGERQDLRHAALWGLGLTAILEMPRTLARLVDIDAIDSTGAAEAVLAEVVTPNDEFEVVIRSASRFVSRLKPVPLGSTKPCALEPSGTYLVTGGLGTLGLEIGDWLGSRGVRRVLLLGRSGFDAEDRSESGRARRRRIDALRERGVDVQVLTADVCDLEQLETVCAPYVASGELLGVFHLAGTYSNRLIENMTSQDFAQVADAKTRGTLNLHRVTRSLSLDHFVLFSSAAAVWGAATGAHYGAANFFLDAFASVAALDSLPAVSIDWGGLWEDSGIIPERHLREFKSIGIGTTTRATGIEQLEAILGSGRRHTVVAPIDWGTFVPVMNARRPHPLFFDIRISEESGNDSAPAIDLPALLQMGSDDDARTTAREHLESELRGTLGIAPKAPLSSARGFYELGLDSLTSIDLRSRLEARLGLSLSTTELFDYNTLDALADRVVDTSRHPTDDAKTSRDGWSVPDTDGGGTAPKRRSTSVESQRPTKLASESGRSDPTDPDELAGLDAIALGRTLRNELASLESLRSDA